MGPSDVIEYIMRSLVAVDDPEPDSGLRVLMSFSVAYEDGKSEDVLGQVQPGCFSDPQSLGAYFASGRYAALGSLEEWKCMGTPDMSNMSRNAAQKLLIRRDGSNWQDLFINLILADSQVGGAANKRWLVTSVYMSGN